MANKKNVVTNKINETKDKLKGIGFAVSLTSTMLASVLGVRVGQGIAVEHKVESKFPGYEVTDISWKPFGNF